MAFTFGSLFSGIGGIDLGLERAGMTCRWQVEIDDYCRRVLAKHWPNTPRYGDIRQLSGDELERVDILAGGFPCQDVSLAGKRAGLDGERSGLWSEYRRLIGILRPRYVLIENVPGLFTAGLDRVVCDLAALGFDAEWTTLRASDFGAPHRRERVFIVAHADRGRREQRDAAEWGVPIVSASNESVEHSNRAGRQELRRTLPASSELAGTQCSVPYPPGPDDREGWRDYLAVYPTLEPSFCRGADGVPAGLVRNRVAQLKAYGNAVVPDCAEYIGRRVLEVEACR